MNTNIRLFIATILTITLAACQDLDVNPKNFYSDENFFETLDETESGLIYAYDALTYKEYSEGLYFIGELPSNNYTVKDDEGRGSQELDRWLVTGNEVIPLNYFRYSYIAINRANAVINSIVENGFVGEVKDQILGEAYFLRAYSHFNLLRIYGLTPQQASFVDQLSETNADMPIDLEESYAFVISDLKEANRLMSIKRIVGRADKVAAQALLAKVYLFAASAKESGVPQYDALVDDVTTLYTNATTYADSVINFQNEYSFDTNLINIYSIDNPQGPEHIFMSSLDVSGTEEGDYSKLGKLFTPYVDATKFQIMNPDSTYILGGAGWGVFITNESFVATFDKEDKRRSELMVDEVYDEEAKTSLGTFQNGFIPYRFTRKYSDPNFEGEKSSARPYLLRFTDVLMIYAEAKAEGDALEAYNKVRRRAGVEELLSLDGLSKAQFRTLVIDERSREFAFEGDRLYDLRRTKTVQKEVGAAAGLSDVDASFYPIPQREIDLNPNF